MERSRGYASVGSLWSPGYFRADLVPAATSRWSRPPSRGKRFRRCRRRTRRRPRYERRRRLIAMPGRRRGSARRGAGARRRPVHHHAGRPRRGSGARPRRRRGSADRDRRLSLVHRLGPRHDDQPRGADAGHGPLPRGGLHPADVRALHSRRAHPEHVPRRRARGALSHRRRDAVVLPRGGALRRVDRRRRHAAQLLPELIDIVAHHLRGTRSASASIRPTACCARAQRAIS